MTDTYWQYVSFKWAEKRLNVVIVPAPHGEVLNERGWFGNRSVNNLDAAQELTPRNSYIEPMRRAVADWSRAMREYGPTWLRPELVTYVLGEDRLPSSALQRDGVVWAVPVTTLGPLVGGAGGVSVGGMEFGVTRTGRYAFLCYSLFQFASATPEDVYNLFGHEFGHCLGLDHTENNQPDFDIMRAKYVHPLGQRANDAHCPSNLNVKGLEVAFGDAFGRPQPDVPGNVALPAKAYRNLCGAYHGAPAPGDVGATAAAKSEPRRPRGSGAKA